MFDANGVRGTNNKMRARAFAPLALRAGLFLSATACTRSVPDLSAAASTSAVTVVDRGSVMSADALRTGWYSDEPQLDPLTVGSPDFGQVFDATVDGQIYAQPLYWNGAVIIATETNRVSSLDAATGAVNWTRQVAAPWNAADVVGCGSPGPWVGITGTPAIDPTTQTVYLFSKTYVNGVAGAAMWLAHGIDLTTGAERAGFPVTITGSADNDPTQSFNSVQELQRPGLLLLNGVVYAAFGSNCDVAPYSGWIIGVSTAGALTARWTTEAGASKSNGGGIWMSGGGLVSDGDGQILFATGNDASAATTPIPGHQPPSALGESVVRLNVQADGTLAATDFFSPIDTPALNMYDADLGAGAPVALPASFGTPAHPSLLVHAGKQGYFYLLDRTDLGGYLTNPGNTDRVLQRIGPNGGVWSKPSVWPGDGGYLYIPVVNGCTGTTDGSGCLQAYQPGAAGDGTPTLSLVAKSATTFGYGSSPVVVTSNGLTSGSALLWAVWMAGSNSTTSQLRAYDAVPVGGVLNLRYVVGVGDTVHFTPPAVGGGRIYVGTGDGLVLGFGLTGTPALHAQGVAFAPTIIGDSLVSNVQIVASRTVQVVGLGVTGDFTVTADAPSVPFTAVAGDTITVPIAFRPTMEGPDSGTLTVTTDQGTFPIPLTGVGESAVPLLVGVAFGRVVRAHRHGDERRRDGLGDERQRRAHDGLGERVAERAVFDRGSPRRGHGLGRGRGVHRDDHVRARQRRELFELLRRHGERRLRGRGHRGLGARRRQAAPRPRGPRRGLVHHRRRLDLGVPADEHRRRPRRDRAVAAPERARVRGDDDAPRGDEHRARRVASRAGSRRAHRRRSRERRVAHQCQRRTRAARGDVHGQRRRGARRRGQPAAGTRRGD